jgi:hypothetical protein
MPAGRSVNLCVVVWLAVSAVLEIFLRCFERQEMFERLVVNGKLDDLPARGVGPHHITLLKDVVQKRPCLGGWIER